MQYPSSLSFTTVKDGVRVERVKKGKYSPDIWAISYLLNETQAFSNTVNNIYLNEEEPTVILRLYFLPKIFSGFSFLPDVTKKAEEIIKKIKNCEYVTYAKDYKLKDRGTKDKKESLLENYIFNNLSKCLCGEFQEDKIGIRQFPANFFNQSVKECNRVGRKYWIDILSVNKLNQLSVIELKAGHNAPLDLFVQALDYGIFAHLFKEVVAGHAFIRNDNILRNKIAVYLVAEKFHPAIVGSNKTKGIISCLKNNELFDIHFIEFQQERYELRNSRKIQCA